MPEGSSASIDGVVDVSIIIPMCFDNPLKNDAVGYISDILVQKRKTIIPITSLIGAYHIATRYLRIPRLTVKKILDGLLRTRSLALYPHVTIALAIDALDYAAAWNIESWDGYLIALARNLGTTTIYTLDKEMSEIKEIMAINPFPEEKVREYHNFVKNLTKA